MSTKQRKKKLYVGLVALCILFSPVSTIKAQGAEINAVVSILPQAYFVERIGGPAVNVTVLVEPGHSPATYETTPRQMTALGNAHVYFRIGTPFEKGLMRKLSGSFQSLKIVDIRNGISLRYFDWGAAHQIPDPHIWLDPINAKIQAGTVCTALSLIDPEQAPTFEKNMRKFIKEMDRLHAEIKKILAPLKGRTFYVFHPAFGYFGELYGMKQVAIQKEGKEPTARQLAALIEQARSDNVKVVFVQPQHAKKDAEAIAAAVGGTTMSLNPLPKKYMAGLRKIAVTLRTGLSR